MALRKLRSLAPNRSNERPLTSDVNYSKVILQKTYVLEQVLGQGTNAKVHKAKEKKKSKGRVVAVKIMKTKEEIEEENRGKSSAIEEEMLFRHEIEVMLKIKERLPKHPYIMELIKVCMSDDPLVPPARPCFVLEYLPGGELFDRIVEKSYYTESDAAALFKKLMLTLRDLHKAGIVHRDLKPENIIFGESEDVIKICDFGTAKLMDSDKEDIFADFKVGSPGYFAPETIYKKYHPANDVWSMGCILYTLLAGYMPFDMDDPMLIVKLLTCNYDFPEDTWGKISGDAKDLIKQMLSTPHTERITAEQVLGHKWFKKQQRRPSQANLGQTLVNLKVLNDEKEKNRQLMREYFFNNVMSARNKMTKMITRSTRGGVKVVHTGLRSVRSRGMSAWSTISQSSSSDLRSSRSTRKSRDANGNITLKHIEPKNRQDLLTDIRTRPKQEADADPDFNEARNRSKSSFISKTQTLTGAMARSFKKSIRSRRPKEPKNIQALLSDIRTRKSVVLQDEDLRFTSNTFVDMTITPLGGNSARKGYADDESDEDDV